MRDSYVTAAAKAGSTFIKFNFSGFCPNETSVLEKQAKHGGVEHSTEANLATGEREPGAFMQEWLAEWAAGVAAWWVRCGQKDELMEKNQCVGTG